MILVDNLIAKTKQRINKLATNDNQEIGDDQLYLIFNEAQIKLVKKKAGKPGQRKYEDIQFLIEKPEDHKLSLKLVDKKLNRWEAALPTKPQYMLYVDSYILAEKGVCKDHIVWVNPDLVGHGNIPLLLTNSNYKPSFEYQETFCDLTKNTIGIYTDGSFTPKHLFLSYIRLPEKIEIKGVENFGAEPFTTNKDSEFPEILEDELLDIICADIAQYTENTTAYQATKASSQEEK